MIGFLCSRLSVGSSCYCRQSNRQVDTSKKDFSHQSHILFFSILPGSFTFDPHLPTLRRTSLSTFVVFCSKKGNFACNNHCQGLKSSVYDKQVVTLFRQQLIWIHCSIQAWMLWCFPRVLIEDEMRIEVKQEEIYTFSSNTFREFLHNNSLLCFSWSTTVSLVSLALSQQYPGTNI